MVFCGAVFAQSSFASDAPKPWLSPEVDTNISQMVLYLPIANKNVKAIQIQAIDEEVVDLLKINNPRIKPLASIDLTYKNTYESYSKIRLSVYKKLLKMLELLPDHIGIAYFEGLRPLWKQKEYFDKKFREIFAQIKDKYLAYEETTKHVSPFIDNIPTHATGAAIDITLFEIDLTNGEKLINMGMFDTIYGYNPQQETFSENTTSEQRKNRLLLLKVATEAGLVNYGFEWWHYSYGDKAWAYVTKQKAFYGLVVESDDKLLLMDKETYLQNPEKI